MMCNLGNEKGELFAPRSLVHVFDCFHLCLGLMRVHRLSCISPFLGCFPVCLIMLCVFSVSFTLRLDVFVFCFLFFFFNHSLKACFLIHSV